MKKILSVVLALVMVLTTATMLIPTAWAEPLAPEPYVPAPKPTGSWVYYEQNFDNAALAELEDAALAEAIGWDELTATETMQIVDGKLRFVSQYYKTGTTKASAYNTTLISETDDRMLSSTTVVEYDLRFQRRAKDAANNVSVNDGAKTVAADGQDGSGISVSVDMGNNSGMIYATKFPVKGNLSRRVAKGTGKTISNGDLSLAMKNSVDLVNDIPEGTTEVTLEKNGPTKRFGMDYHVKAVYNPIQGMYYLELNGQVISRVSCADNYAGSLRLLAENILSQFVLTIGYSADVLLDNIQIYGYGETPALVISEVAPNGYGVKADGQHKNGGYQWIEVYNPNAADVNVYDYALHVNNAPTKEASVFGQNSDVTTGRGSSLGYLKEGTQTFTLTEGTSTFENPAYADGVLGAGETAILILPDALHASNLSLDQDQITDQMKKFGMPEGTKIFVCDNYDEYSMVLSSEGAMTLGLMKVSNPAGNDVVGIHAGANDDALMLLESYVILTSDKSTSSALYEGIGMNMGYIPYESILNLAKKTVEIGYWGIGADGSALAMGQMMINAKTLRPMANGESGYATPGYVGEALRSTVSFQLTDASTGAVTTEYGSFMSNWRMDEEDRYGYEFLGYRYEGTTEYFDSVFVFETGAKVIADYRRMAPTFIGYQVSELNEGKYTVRLLGGIDHKDLEAVGFKYSYTYVNASGRTITVEDQVYSCEFIYTGVTVADVPVTAADLGYEYLYALHINNIPEAVSAIDFKVSAFTVKDKFDAEPIYDAEQTFRADAPVANG